MHRNSFQGKYLKYKKKYLELRGGGEITVKINYIDRDNYTVAEQTITVSDNINIETLIKLLQPNVKYAETRLNEPVVLLKSSFDLNSLSDKNKTLSDYGIKTDDVLYLRTVQTRLWGFRMNVGDKVN